MSERTAGQVTGYAVALPDRYDTGQTIWFGGSKLAPDLTLPQLQRRRAGRGPDDGAPPEPLGHPAWRQTPQAAGARPPTGSG